MTQSDVKFYIETAQTLTRLLCEKFSVRYPLKAWIQGHRPQKEKIRNDGEYYFHGMGYTYTLKNEKDKELDVNFIDDKLIIDPKNIYYFTNNEFIEDHQEITKIRKEVEDYPNVRFLETVYGQSNVISIF